MIVFVESFDESFGWMAYLPRNVRDCSAMGLLMRSETLLWALANPMAATRAKGNSSS